MLILFKAFVGAVHHLNVCTLAVRNLSLVLIIYNATGQYSLTSISNLGYTVMDVKVGSVKKDFKCPFCNLAGLILKPSLTN